MKSQVLDVGRLSLLLKGNIAGALQTKYTSATLTQKIKLKKVQQDFSTKVREGVDDEKLNVTQRAKLLKLQDDVAKGLIHELDIEEELKGIKGLSQNQQADILETMNETANSRKKLLKTEEEGEEAQERLNKRLAIGGALVGGLALGFKKLIDGITDFDKKFNAVGDTFGDLTLNGQDFNTDLVNIAAQAGKIGFGLEDVLGVTVGLSSEFGVSLDVAKDLSLQVLDTSKAVGLTREQGTKLIGTFMKLSGLSAEQAIQLTEATAQLARQNQVAPVAVLEDLASSAEAIALFTREGTNNIAEAAVAARQQGRDFNSIAESAEAVLDIEQKRRDAADANALFGTSINLQQLQNLAFQSDLVGFQREQVRLAKILDKFAGDDVISRRIAAKTISATVVDFEKMVNSSGQMAKQKDPFRDLLGERAQGNITSLINKFKSLAAVALNVLGPGIQIIVGGIEDFIAKKGGLDGIEMGFLSMQTKISELAQKFSDDLQPRVESFVKYLTTFFSEGGGFDKVQENLSNLTASLGVIAGAFINLGDVISATMTRIKAIFTGAAAGAVLGAIALALAPATGGLSLAALPAIKGGMVAGAVVGAGLGATAELGGVPNNGVTDINGNPVVPNNGATSANQDQVVKAIEKMEKGLTEELKKGIPVSGKLQHKDIVVSTDPGIAGGQPGSNNSVMLRS